MNFDQYMVILYVIFGSGIITCMLCECLSAILRGHRQQRNRPPIATIQLQRRIECTLQTQIGQNDPSRIQDFPIAPSVPIMVSQIPPPSYEEAIKMESLPHV